jgi:hypothetical protein
MVLLRKYCSTEPKSERLIAMDNLARLARVNGDLIREADTIIELIAGVDVAYAVWPADPDHPETEPQRLRLARAIRVKCIGVARLTRTVFRKARSLQ